MNIINVCCLRLNKEKRRSERMVPEAKDSIQQRSAERPLGASCRERWSGREGGRWEQMMKREVVCG